MILRCSGIAALALLLAAIALPAWAAQNDNRTVTGLVVDKGDAPVAKAIVYLKNLKTLQVRTFISDEKGGFQFHGLSTNVDYEVHAESDGASSSTRTISSFDSRKQIHVSLKIDKK